MPPDKPEKPAKIRAKGKNFRMAVEKRISVTSSRLTAIIRVVIHPYNLPLLNFLLGREPHRNMKELGIMPHLTEGRVFTIFQII